MVVDRLKVCEVSTCAAMPFASAAGTSELPQGADDARGVRRRGQWPG